MSFKYSLDNVDINIIDEPDKFIALYDIIIPQHDLTSREQLTQAFFDGRLLDELRQAKVKGDPTRKINRKSYFARLVAKFWTILQRREDLKAATRELIEFLFQYDLFNPDIADLYMIDEEGASAYIRRTGYQADATVWLIAHPKIMYACFVTVPMCPPPPLPSRPSREEAISLDVNNRLK